MRMHIVPLALIAAFAVTSAQAEELQAVAATPSSERSVKTAPCKELAVRLRDAQALEAKARRSGDIESVRGYRIALLMLRGTIAQSCSLF